MTGAVDTDLGVAVKAAAAGDDAAFARIVGAYHEDMRRVCVVMTGDQQLAEDAVQAAWSIAWRKLGTLRQPERLRPWLVSVAMNQARDMIRKRRRTPEAALDTTTARVTGGVDPATGIESLDLLAAMERLDPDDRALIAMRYVAGFDATEIGTAIGLSPSGTRTRLERVLARLRQELA
jgi:RNA polymerase sigma factor (sigma-70 family)